LDCCRASERARVVDQPRSPLFGLDFLGKIGLLVIAAYPPPGLREHCVALPPNFRPARRNWQSAADGPSDRLCAFHTQSAAGMALYCPCSAGTFENQSLRHRIVGPRRPWLLADSLWLIGQARELKLPQSMTPKMEANQGRGSARGRHVQLVLGFRLIDDPITERASFSATLPSPDRFGDLRWQQALRDALDSYSF